jgi:hypothetical protein
MRASGHSAIASSYCSVVIRGSSIMPSCCSVNVSLAGCDVLWQPIWGDIEVCWAAPPSPPTRPACSPAPGTSTTAA